MSLPPLAGHEDLRRRLDEAAREGRLPQSLLFHGPEGVGKQRLALWLGRRLLCPEGGCGDCRSCRLADRLEHPDLHWFFPLPRPKGASSREKLREKLEEARLEALEERRSEPLAVPGDEGATGIYLAAVEEMRHKASRRPAMGRSQVFVVGDAEAMVPQAASQQAANAFLKLLEEPPEDTWVILTSSRRGALLPTVRSRVLALRVPPLSRDEVETFLREEAGADPEAARAAARRAQGSIGRALRELSDEEADHRERAESLVRAALSSRPADRWEAAARVSPSGARGGFSETLGAVAELLRDLAAVASGQEDRTFQPDRARRLASEADLSLHGLAGALDRVEEARTEAAGNVNPQALTATLLHEMARELTR